ncbi:MAG: hypothetical protein ACRCSG_02820 [Cellulosilyticaceae bacterium]
MKKKYNEKLLIVIGFVVSFIIMISSTYIQNETLQSTFVIVGGCLFYGILFYIFIKYLKPVLDARNREKFELKKKELELARQEAQAKSVFKVHTPTVKTEPKVSYGKWIELSNGFGQLIHVKGVTFDNRQDVISQLKTRSKVTPRYYTYNNQPAIELLYEGESIGNVPKELAKALTELKPFFHSIVIKSKYKLASDTYISEFADPEDYEEEEDEEYGIQIDYRIKKDAYEILKEKNAI